MAQESATVMLSDTLKALFKMNHVELGEVWCKFDGIKDLNIEVPTCTQCHKLLVDIKKLEVENEELHKTINEIKYRILGYDEEKDRILNENKKYEKDLDEAFNKLAKLREKYKVLDKKLKMKESELRNSKKDLRKLQKEFVDLANTQPPNEGIVPESSEASSPFGTSATANKLRKKNNVLTNKLKKEESGLRKSQKGLRRLEKENASRANIQPPIEDIVYTRQIDRYWKKVLKYYNMYHVVCGRIPRIVVNLMDRVFEQSDDVF